MIKAKACRGGPLRPPCRGAHGGAPLRISIPTDPIKGSNRLNTKEYRRFVGIAKGSIGEISYQIFLARDLGYVSEEAYTGLANKYKIVIKMLSNLAKSLGKRTK